MASYALDLTIILAIAFLPSIYYMVRARNSERYGREPYGRLGLVFAYGAIVAILISIVFELVILGNLDRFERIYNLGDESFLGAVLVAPVVEESVKAFGLIFILSYVLRDVDAMVYGVAIGLGFAATENMLYELSALSVSLEAYLATAIIRTVSSTLLHATATGVTGLGVGRAVVRKSALYTAFPYLLVAIAMHATFNFIASLGVTFPDAFGTWTIFISLMLTIAFAGYAWSSLRSHIRAA